MKIVQVASELFPYVKTGGLADAAGSLSATLAKHGHQVCVFLPGYRAVLDHPDASGAERLLRLKIEMGDVFMSGEVRVFSPRPNQKIYLICRDELFDRKGVYGNGERDYEDNYHRYIFFCKGVVETLRQLNLQADIVHAHDWQAAMLPLLLRYTERRTATALALKTVFTIHNIAFQGLYPMRSFYRTNLPDELKGVDGLEYYGQMNFLKGGILFADQVTTVSPRYAQEIQTPEFGCGLDGVIATRAEDIVGLINGIDTTVWNPATDAHIPASYTASDLSGKATCRAGLLKKMQLDPAPADVPVYGMVCRLTEQKGVQLLLANRDFFLNHDCRLVILGSGDKRLEQAVRDLAAAAPRKIGLAMRLDESMSHLIEAGSDFFLMPSLFEPCGLNQMYSLAYGTPPLVTQVGGLHDTVTDADASPDAGTGITFAPDADALREGLQRSLKLFADKPRYAAVQARGMATDNSWDNAARAYERLYTELL
ncbi:starch synthase [Ereboglobus sp. PH5-5]|uniref:glycogen synthase GlgA n=1 Tax=Ereboglobus sp. PH5-5 TaxID=2940529 RepID=UPI002405FF5B|nr:glycogen synthase GlgA [Ereboglobus sp. PH5-5]MDF9832307.1 starch synthase [Ereboglobus sp. PH5-5]